MRNYSEKFFVGCVLHTNLPEELAGNARPPYFFIIYGLANGS
jgi:hypothetical protein